MKNLESLWKETKYKFDGLERSLVDCYIGFMRETARIYLQQGRRVFFGENRFVHWGEGDFGRLVIEGNEKVGEVFGDYISEIRFEPQIREKVVKGYLEIKKENLEDIKWRDK